jgi:HSP20 family molecular chaperone IbpA
MNTELPIPKELLAGIDFGNTINGGIAPAQIQAWREEDGYRLRLKAPGFDRDKIRIETTKDRFMIYYPMSVLGSEVQYPYFFVNFPIDPQVDVKKISAKPSGSQGIFLIAPFKTETDSYDDDVNQIHLSE